MAQANIIQNPRTGATHYTDGSGGTLCGYQLVGDETPAGVPSLASCTACRARLDAPSPEPGEQVRVQVGDPSRRMLVVTGIGGATDDEIAIVQGVAERIMGAGRQSYGALDVEHDKRSYLEETRQELIDALVYLGAEERRRQGTTTPEQPTGWYSCDSCGCRCDADIEAQTGRDGSRIMLCSMCTEARRAWVELDRWKAAHRELRARLLRIADGARADLVNAAADTDMEPESRDDEAYAREAFAGSREAGRDE